MPLRVGQTMTFSFDFGDQWQLDVTLEQIEPDRVVSEPAIIEAHGDPPEQYPNWDEKVIGDWGE